MRGSFCSACYALLWSLLWSIFGARQILGYETRDLFAKGTKTLGAGAVGIAVGTAITWLLIRLGLPYLEATWPGYALGFLANFATQVKLKNIVVKKA